MTEFTAAQRITAIRLESRLTLLLFCFVARLSVIFGKSTRRNQLLVGFCPEMLWAVVASRLFSKGIFALKEYPERTHWKWVFKNVSFSLYKHKIFSDRCRRPQI